MASLTHIPVIHALLTARQLRSLIRPAGRKAAVERIVRGSRRLVVLSFGAAMTCLAKLDHELDKNARTCRAIVETPAGRRSKFSYREASGLFELSGILPAGMAFPLAFGFVPGTLAEDGDPVDVLILVEDELPVGCLLTVKLLGVIEAEQTQDGNTCRNDRLIARAAQSRMYADVNDLDCLGPTFVEELSRFFITFNDLKGKRFEVLSVEGGARACQLVAESTR